MAAARKRPPAPVARRRAAPSSPTEREILWGGPSGPGLVYVAEQNTRSIEQLTAAVAENSAAIAEQRETTATAISALAEQQRQHAEQLAADVERRRKASEKREKFNEKLQTTAVRVGVTFFTILVGAAAWAQALLNHTAAIHTAVTGGQP